MKRELTFAYVVRLTDPSRFGKLSPDEEKVVDEHFNRLKSALTKGKLILAGPCLDGAFGIVVFKTASKKSAERFMKEGPAVKAGVMAAELHPFRVSLIQESRNSK